MIDQLAMTTPGRRGLIQVATAIVPLENEMVFFICAKDYQAKPSKTKASFIHAIFLQMATPVGTIITSSDRFSFKRLAVRQSVVGAQNYKTYQQRFISEIALPQASAVSMNPLKRILTSKKRKAPSDLFDGMLGPIRQQLQPFMANHSFAFAKQAINGWRLGNQGGGSDREQGKYQAMVSWSNQYATQLDQSGCFSATALGIKDIFAAQNVT